MQTIKLTFVSIILFLALTNTLKSQLYINEVVAVNDATIADNYGEYDDWIEIYNAGGTAVNLAGYYISDDADNPTQWQIPATNSSLTTVPAGGYRLFWADNETAQGANHLNFKLGGSGEQVVLTAPDGVTTISQLTFPALALDFGYGHLPDGSGNLSALTPASPAATNNNSQPKVETPVFSISGGMYGGAQSVSISTITSGSTIRYTTDGSEPTGSSTAYSGAIYVNSITVLRARAFRSGYAASDVASATYLIGVNHDLPVVCINTDPDNLWDDQIGIHVTGTNGITGNCNDTPKNYNQPWERPANIQMYESDGTFAFNIDAGISISGGCSRNNAQKSLNIATKKIYGTEQIDYQLFPERDQHEFRRFKLRNAGNDWGRTSMCDAVVQELVKEDVDIEASGFRPSIVYLNGEYWGLMNIREIYSEHYLNYRFPKIDKDSVDIHFLHLYGDVNEWDIEVKEGDPQAFLDLYNFVKDNSMNNAANYAQVKNLMDINEYINYNIIQIHSGNTDWPSNNVRVWRDQRDGKFRWILFDTDFALGRQENGSNSRTANPPSFNTLYQAVRSDQSGWPNDYASTRMLRRLLQNTEFKNEFIQRFATQINVLFDPARAAAIVDNFKANMQPEMQDHLTKWNLNGQSVSTWGGKVDRLKSWLSERPPYMRQHIRDYFGIGGTYNLTLNFNQNTGGVVAVNSNEFVVPFNYTGNYFDNIPLQLRAVPNPGYRFVRWQETGNTNASITVNYSSAQTLTPVFEPALDVVINEIHYHPSDSINEKEFIEIYNPDTKARDLSDYEFSEGICFKFPKGTTINPGEYIVIAADATQYLGNGYQVFQWEESKLNNDGEKLWLDNSISVQIDTTRYNDGIPWALLADGFGASLELNYPVPADNIAPADWHASAPTGGTPGAQNSTPCTNPTQQIVINEINYNSDNLTNPGDWIELHNPNSTSINISNWQFYDSENTFTIPAGTTLEANDFLVLAEDAALFGSIFPHLNNGTDFIGNLAFNISNGGERVSLFDQNKCLVDELRFDDNMPWDTIPDGNGPTLSLITPNSDNLLPQSWEASSEINSAYGTPARENTPCPEVALQIPSVICAGVPTTLKIDNTYDDMTFNWFAFGASPANSTADSITVVWNSGGTYNVQLLTNYFECPKSYIQAVTVEDCNTAPLIIDDNFSTTEENMVSGDVMLNDSDPDGDNLTVNTTPVINPSNGTVVINPDGTFSYTPNPDFYGTDNFTYEACDDASLGTVITTPGSFSGEVASGADDVEELSTGVIEVTSTDLDLMEDSPSIYTAVGIRIRNISVPQGATITGAYLEFVADEAQSVATSLTIKAEATGNAAAIPTTAYALTNKNKTNASVAWANIPAWTIGNTYQSADISTIIQELVNRGDWSSGNAMTFIIEGSGTRTAESFEGTARTKLFIDYETTSSGNPASTSICEIAVVTINVAPVNDAPTATNGTATTNEDNPFNGSVMTDVTEVDGDVLIMNTTPISDVSNGTLTLNSNGTYSYVPDANFSGTDSFTYEICDNTSPALCTQASVTITVNEVNDTPIAMIDFYNIQEDTPVFGDVLANDSDVENQTLNVTTVSNPGNGTLNLNPNGTFTYTPNTDFSGFDTFTYEVCDNGSPVECNTAAVNINIIGENDAPTAVNDNATTPEETSKTGNVLNNDNDVDGDNLTVNITPITPPQNGSFFLLASGVYSYTPHTDFYGTDFFEYEICDDGNPVLCDTASVTIDVTPVNDTPIANDDIWEVAENTMLSDNVILNDIDPDGDALGVNVIPIISPTNGTLVFNADGTFDYMPNTGYIGADSFMYEVCELNSSNTNTITANISTGTNDIEERASNGSILTGDATLDMVTKGNTTYSTGLRYTNLNIPAGATITNAYLSINANASTNDASTLNIAAHDTGNAGAFSTAAYSLTNLPKTTAVTWSNVPAWTAGATYNTPNLSAVIQSIINRADWSAGNAISFIIDGSGTRRATSFEGGNAPQLHIEYELFLCDIATVNINVVQPCVDIELYAFLEGPYDPNTGEMQTNLNNSRGLLPGQTPASGLATPTPAGQPYNAAPWNYTGTEGADWTDADYADDVVDWLLIGFRTGTDKSTEVTRTAALLHNNGSITFPDRCALTTAMGTSFYIVIEHRNHIGVMTPQLVDVVNNTLLHDFRFADSFRDVTSFGQKQLATGEWVMFAGDGDQSDFPSYDVNGTDKTIWFDNNGIFDYYFSPDFNLDGDINGQDKTLWFENNGISSRVPK